MFYSLIQTLVCVLLIHGGLNALHLNNNAETNSAKIAAEPAVMLQHNPNHEHVQHASSSLKQYETAGRLSDALADLAQLDREHLMSSIDKQAEVAAAERHHGRPIIAGRIHMSPKNELMGEGDYSSLLLPSLPRGFMFGHVVKQPPAENDDGLGLNDNYARTRPIKYEYGRVVQPVQEAEYDAHLPLDLNSFVELEQQPTPDVDDDFDLDSYQYLDELLAEDQQREWQELSQRSSNPYHTVDDVQADKPLDLMELFQNKEQSKPPTQRQFQTRSGYRQKWQTKRARQAPLKRNIFEEQQPQPRFFNQRHNNMFSALGSEATAYSKHNNNNQQQQQQQQQQQNENTKSAKELNDNLKSAVKLMRNHNNQDASTQRQQTSAQKQEQQQQQKQTEHRLKEEVLAHPNQKRSGGGLLPSGMSTAGSHSIASQLMLRTARGQRQYDVPQIGKSINLH